MVSENVKVRLSDGMCTDYIFCVSFSEKKTNSCRYYGLSVWFPDVIRHLQADDYAFKVQRHNNEQIEDFTFNFTLENQIHINGVFINDRYTSLI